MTASIPDRVFKAALAGLLHGVGEFAQWAGERPVIGIAPADSEREGYHALLRNAFVSKYVPEPLQDSLAGVLFHHKPQDDQPVMAQEAYWLSAGGHREGEVFKSLQNQARLIPILGRVNLGKPLPMGKFRHRLAALEVNTAHTYPITEEHMPSASKDEFANLWLNFTQELDAWKQSLGENWRKQAPSDYLVTLLAIFRKYTWCIPDASFRQPDLGDIISPDVSMYDHSRLTSAIAACLAFEDSQEIKKKIKKGEPVLQIVRGDLSGIQQFIYSITQPEAETEHVAKRLRGRSMYIALLMEIVADWILNEIGLPPTCSLYVGGGKFDLMLPLSGSKSIDIIENRLGDWLLNTFFGELSIHFARCNVTPTDLADMRRVYKQLCARKSCQMAKGRAERRSHKVCHCPLSQAARALAV